MGMNKLTFFMSCINAVLGFYYQNIQAAFGWMVAAIGFATIVFYYEK